MNGFVKYIVPVAFIILAGYNLYLAHWLEGSLYAAVAIAFPLMWAIKEGYIKTNLKLWNAVAWALVILALVLFMALLRQDAYNQ